MSRLKVLPLYEAEAQARKVAGQNYGEGHPLEVGANWHQPLDQPKPRAPRAVDKAAKSAGTSGRALARGKRITEQAPDLAERVAAGDDLTFAPRRPAGPDQRRMTTERTSLSGPGVFAGHTQ